MPTPAKYTWMPSSARIVVLDGFGAIPRGTTQFLQPPLAWPAKDPGDTLDYVVDISEAVAGDTGDAIADLDVLISPNTPGDLSLQSSCVDGTQVVLWLSAGFSGTTYAVTVSVVTNAGRVLGRTINLPVLALATPPVPVSAITDQSGSPLTDQNGSPVTS